MLCVEEPVGLIGFGLPCRVYFLNAVLISWQRVCACVIFLHTARSQLVRVSNFMNFQRKSVNIEGHLPEVHCVCEHVFL